MEFCAIGGDGILCHRGDGILCHVGMEFCAIGGMEFCAIEEMEFCAIGGMEFCTVHRMENIYQADFFLHTIDGSKNFSVLLQFRGICFKESIPRSKIAQ